MWCWLSTSLHVEVDVVTSVHPAEDRFDPSRLLNSRPHVASSLSAADIPPRGDLNLDHLPHLSRQRRHSEYAARRHRGHSASDSDSVTDRPWCLDALPACKETLNVTS